MLTMSQVNYIRDLSNSGYQIAEISKKLKLDRKTVRKYLNQEDFSPTPPVKHPVPSKLDPYKPKILEWLAEDQHVCQGLRNIFEYIGGVPPLLIFDNATGVGKRVGSHVHEDGAVPALPRALRMPREVLQSICGLREGQCRAQGRLCLR